MDNSGGTACSKFAVSRVIEEHYGIYPDMSAFGSGYGVQEYCEWVEESNGDPLPAPLALYIQDNHGRSPITNQTLPASAHRLSAIGRELQLLGDLFDADRPVEQLICSGCIADTWSDDELYELISVVQSSFFITPGSLANWCVCTGDSLPSVSRLRLLRILGFSGVRFSLMPGENLESLYDEFESMSATARDIGFDKIVLDIAPNGAVTKRTLDRLETLLARVRPDRIRLFVDNDEAHLACAGLLQSLGYQNIGMDWFLQPQDQWLRAKSLGQLHWSLLGFTDLSHPDVIGVGPGAISSVGSFYSVNETGWELYSERLGADKLPIAAGLELESDDLLRREIMGMILAGSSIRIGAVEEKWGINFRQFFAWETDRLRALEQNQWVAWQDDVIAIQVQGSRELVELCRIFDRRRRDATPAPQLSLV